jgi:hypothetical protein
MSMKGIRAAYKTAYYYINFGSSKIFAWDQNCQRQVSMESYSAGACSTAPTFMQDAFNGENLYSTGNVKTFMTNGYDITGSEYFSEVCFGTNFLSCVDAFVVAAEYVNSDYWLLNQDGAYGNIGLSPESKLWESFIDHNTRQAQYTVSILR